VAGKDQKASQKKLQRSARNKGRNAAMRPIRIKRARARHLKNARQSCGQAFAERLELHYAAHPAEMRHQGRKA